LWGRQDGLRDGQGLQYTSYSELACERVHGVWQHLEVPCSACQARRITIRFYGRGGETIFQLNNNMKQEGPDHTREGPYDAYSRERRCKRYLTYCQVHVVSLYHHVVLSHPLGPLTHGFNSSHAPYSATPPKSRGTGCDLHTPNPPKKTQQEAACRRNETPH
jgi:hypothetical protein